MIKYDPTQDILNLFLDAGYELLVNDTKFISYKKYGVTSLNGEQWWDLIQFNKDSRTVLKANSTGSVSSSYSSIEVELIYQQMKSFKWI